MGMHCEFGLSGRVKPDDGGGMFKIKGLG